MKNKQYNDYKKWNEEDGEVWLNEKLPPLFYKKSVMEV